jgi:hypothetical protein
VKVGDGNEIFEDVLTGGRARRCDRERACLTYGIIEIRERVFICEAGAIARVRVEPARGGGGERERETTALGWNRGGRGNHVRRCEDRRGVDVALMNDRREERLDGFAGAFAFEQLGTEPSEHLRGIGRSAVGVGQGAPTRRIEREHPNPRSPEHLAGARRSRPSC